MIPSKPRRGRERKRRWRGRRGSRPRSRRRVANACAVTRSAPLRAVPRQTAPRRWHRKNRRPWIHRAAALAVPTAANQDRPRQSDHEQRQRRAVIGHLAGTATPGSHPGRRPPSARVPPPGLCEHTQTAKPGDVVGRVPGFTQHRLAVLADGRRPPGRNLVHAIDMER
jgi:hypothetical protein